MSAGPWTLTTRAGSQVDRQHVETIEEALAALERSVEELQSDASREEVRFIGRRIEPARQVVARIELAGPGSRGRVVRGGVDLRGDGSAEAFTGRVRRALVERHGGESAPQALARALST
ncbi:MAG: hypothetical protein ABSH27_12770 [Solirubrobacteraceae bacterium]